MIVNCNNCSIKLNRFTLIIKLKNLLKAQLPNKRQFVFEDRNCGINKRGKIGNDEQLLLEKLEEIRRNLKTGKGPKELIPLV